MAQGFNGGKELVGVLHAQQPRPLNSGIPGGIHP